MSKHNLSSVVIFNDLRSYIFSAEIRRRVHVCDKTDRRCHLTARCRRNRTIYITVRVHTRILHAKFFQLIDQAVCQVKFPVCRRDLLLILVMAVVTFATRLLPFLLFDRGEEPPKAVLYLGRVLPPAIMAMLIVYCLKGVSFATPAGWVPALLSCGAVVLLHLWKGNDLLSIFGGTILYMALVQGVFG